MTLMVQLQPEDEAKLAQKAQDAGVDVSTYVQRVLHVEVSRPRLEEVLRPIHEAFEESGMSEGELAEVLMRAKKEMRADRKGRQAL